MAIVCIGMAIVCMGMAIVCIAIVGMAIVSIACLSSACASGPVRLRHSVYMFVRVCGTLHHRLGSEAPLDSSKTAEEVEMFRRASEVVVEVD
tara:strand:- start:172 stop:447 length:276 start_codon:yes stop_codon:yes gene_type:complete